MRRRRGAIDMFVTVVTLSVVWLFAWYRIWYVYGPKQGWEAGWPATKIVTFAIPVSLVVLGFFFAPRGGFTGRS